jgi:hypothetical protein
MEIINKLTIPGVWLVSGPKRSGKTQLIRYLLQELATKNLFHLIKIFCPTSYNQSYDFIPLEHVYMTYNEVVILELIEEQIELKKQNIHRPALLVLNDCIGSANFRNPLWERLVTTCRHPNITIIVVTQHIYRLPPTLRDNADMVFILKTIDVDNLQGLYDTCRRWKWKTLKDFESFILANTIDFKCVIINPGKSIDIVRAPQSIKKYRINY